MDIYLTEELGKTPLKMVEYHNSNIVMLIEPISVTMGEPEPSLLRGPDYPKAN